MLFAIKIIDKDNLSLRQKNRINNELLTMQKVDHPNIVKYYERYESDTKIFLVMELLAGGEILDYFCKNPSNHNEAFVAT